jgi:predicted secreted protein
MGRWGVMVRCAVVAISLVAVEGMAQQTVASERYSGMMVCADCSGIKTILMLNRSSQGAPINYTMIETFVGRPAAGKPRVTGGTWTIQHGTAADKNATVYQLHQAGSTGVTSFVKVGTELRMLGGDMTELPSGVSHTLKLMVADKVVLKTDGSKDGTVSLKAGGQLEVQLAANHTTGYSWTAVPVENPVLMSEGTATYQENPSDGKVGVGGVEIWRFKATKAGKEDLRFEYRRPWEKGTPAAKTVRIQVKVQSVVAEYGVRRAE